MISEHLTTIPRSTRKHRNSGFFTRDLTHRILTMTFDRLHLFQSKDQSFSSNRQHSSYQSRFKPAIPEGIRIGTYRRLIDAVPYSLLELTRMLFLILFWNSRDEIFVQAKLEQHFRFSKMMLQLAPFPYQSRMAAQAIK